MTDTNVAKWDQRIVEAIRLEAAKIASNDVLEAARKLCRGLSEVVINDSDTAGQVTDRLRQISQARKRLSVMETALFAPIKDLMDEARREAKVLLGPIADELTAGENGAKKALAAWLDEQERVARRQREEALETARKAAAANPKAPPLEVALVEAPKSITTLSSMAYTTSKVVVEVEDPHAIIAYDPALMKLDESAAKALWRDIEKRGTIDPITQMPISPDTDGWYTYRGMRFKRVKGVASR